MAIPTIVVVPGAAHGVEFYSSLLSSLEAKGYPAICQNPPSITAEDATTVTVDADVSFVRNQVLTPLLAEGKDIVLLMHSYGGTYGAAAVQGLSKKERSEKGEQGGVIGLIYAASFTSEPGQSALATLNITTLPGWVATGSKPGTLTFSDRTWLWPDISAEEAAEWMSKLSPVSMTALATPISYAPFQDPYYNDSLAYVHLLRDAIVLPELREIYIEKSGITLTASIDGPHGIGVEVTEEVANVAVELVEKFVTRAS
ncbi:uncharacterized protein BDR25DRAFT_244359 [Lindgomyces ingoldianus]|uniref:Uncharacterized protein n=1 Tax=Lindgomyces ingoldianus TaxID=673940 RepID=A0ACB6QAI0_9PLEO|nr:uncharacterized protein BDR25DRAFT_244359 [Lindgomyces ingoldianus]KAF2463890.1 hypothetical protein BDR25DRAFT_244359 [Lindgomyces ingoldianus]